MSAAEKSTAVPVAQFKLVNDSTLDNKVLDTSMAAFGCKLASCLISSH